MTTTMPPADTDSDVKPRLPADCLSSISMPKNWDQVEKLKNLKEKLKQEIELVARHEKEKAICAISDSEEVNNKNLKYEAAKEVDHKENDNAIKLPPNIMPFVDLNPKVMIEPLKLSGKVDAALKVTSSKDTRKFQKADKPKGILDERVKSKSNSDCMSLSFNDSHASKSVEKESESGGERTTINQVAEEASGERVEDLIHRVVLEHIDETADRTFRTSDLEKLDNSLNNLLESDSHKKQLELTREMIVNKHQSILEKWASDIRRYGLESSRKLAFGEKADFQYLSIPKLKPMKTPKPATKNMEEGTKKYVGPKTTVSLLDGKISNGSVYLTNKADGLDSVYLTNKADGLKDNVTQTNIIQTEQRSEGKSNANTGIETKLSTSSKEAIQDDKTIRKACHYSVDKACLKNVSENSNSTQNLNSIVKGITDANAIVKDSSSYMPVQDKLKSKIASNQSQMKLSAEQQPEESIRTALPGHITTELGQSHSQLTNESTMSVNRGEVHGLKVKITAGKTVKQQLAERAALVNNETNVLKKTLFQNACTTVATKNKLSAIAPKPDVVNVSVPNIHGNTRVVNVSVPNIHGNTGAKSSLLNNNVTISLRPIATKGVAKYSIVEKPTSNMPDMKHQIATNLAKSMSNSTYNYNIGTYGMNANHVKPVNSNYTIVSSSVSLVPLNVPLYNNPSLPQPLNTGLGTFPMAANNSSFSCRLDFLGLVNGYQVPRPVVLPGNTPRTQAPVRILQNSGTIVSSNSLTVGATGLSNGASTYLSSAGAVNLSTRNANWKKKMPVSVGVKALEPKTTGGCRIITPVFYNHKPLLHVSVTEGSSELGTTSAAKRPAETVEFPEILKKVRLETILKNRLETSPGHVVSKPTTGNSELVKTVALPYENHESQGPLSSGEAVPSVAPEKQRQTITPPCGTGVHIGRPIQTDKKYRFHSGKPRDAVNEQQDTVRTTNETSLDKSAGDNHISDVAKSGDDESNLALFEQFKIKPYNPVLNMSGYMTQNDEPKESFKEVLNALPRKENLKSNESVKGFSEDLESMPRIECYYSLADDIVHRPVNVPVRNNDSAANNANSVSASENAAAGLETTNVNVAIHNNNAVRNNENSVSADETLGPKSTNELVSQDIGRVVRVTVDSNRPAEELSLVNIPTDTVNKKAYQILNEHDLVEYLCSTNNEKTKLILLNGNVCDRWEKLKQGIGAGDMSDPEFLHQLLSTAEKNLLEAAGKVDAGSQTDSYSDELAERDPLQHEPKRHQSQLSEKIQDNIRSDCPEIIVIDDDSRDNDIAASSSRGNINPVTEENQVLYKLSLYPTTDENSPGVNEHPDLCLAWNQHTIQLNKNNSIMVDHNNNSDAEHPEPSLTWNKHTVQLDQTKRRMDVHNYNSSKIDLNNNSVTEVGQNKEMEVDLNNNAEGTKNQNLDCSNNSMANVSLLETSDSGKIKIQIGSAVVQIDQNKAVSVEQNTEKKAIMMTAGMKRPASIPLEIQTDNMIAAKRISTVGNTHTTTSSQSSSETGPTPATLSELLKSTAKQTVKAETSSTKPCDKQIEQKVQSAPITSSPHDSQTLLQMYYTEFKCNIPMKKDMDWHISRFREFLSDGNGSGDFEHQTPEWLNIKLILFYLHVSSLYKSNCVCWVGLMIFLNYLSKYVCWLSGNKVNIKEDEAFKKSNDIYTIACKNDSGFVPLYKTTPVFTDEDVVKLKRSGVLSNKTPVNLLWKVYFDINYHLGGHGFTKDYLHSLKKDSLIFSSDDQGNYCALREKKPKMYEWKNNCADCPVRNLRFYLSKLSNNEALFQYPRYVYNQTGVWYSNVQLSKVKLYNLMREISKAAELSHEYTLPSIVLLAKNRRFIKEVKNTLAVQKK